MWKKTQLQHVTRRFNHYQWAYLYPTCNKYVTMSCSPSYSHPPRTFSSRQAMETSSHHLQKDFSPENFVEIGPPHLVIGGRQAFQTFHIPETGEDGFSRVAIYETEL
ncbi:hypothetical protein JTE90_021282 [Oedothorax gibbosus]|uniref:Uncharacterized protein n=1 Tax=Oedothorax gibbosus TaxID=931172 RepID=A0AAV6U7M8_9ARAC|nr:hypothetical protein JTE90_021282 [Oedothorax gibbosus]